MNRHEELRSLIGDWQKKELNEESKIELDHLCTEYVVGQERYEDALDDNGDLNLNLALSKFSEEELQQFRKVKDRASRNALEYSRSKVMETIQNIERNQPTRNTVPPPARERSSTRVTKDKEKEHKKEHKNPVHSSTSVQHSSSRGHDSQNSNSGKHRPRDGGRGHQPSSKESGRKNSEREYQRKLEEDKERAKLQQEKLEARRKAEEAKAKEQENKLELQKDYEIKIQRHVDKFFTAMHKAKVEKAREERKREPAQLVYGERTKILNEVLVKPESHIAKKLRKYIEGKNDGTLKWLDENITYHWAKDGTGVTSKLKN